MSNQFIVGTILACSLFSSSASAFTVTASANFDSFPEGFIGGSITEGGLTFFEGINNPIGGVTTFAIDSTIPALGTFGPKGTNFSPPNFVTVGALAPGPEGNLGSGFKSTRIKADSVNSFATLDFFALKNADSALNTLTLEAFLNGNLVSIDSSLLSDFELVDPGDLLALHRTYRISNVLFDELRLVASGPTNNGIVFGGFDNVVVGVGDSEPHTQAITFNLATDFSLANNPNGVWQYGYSNILGGTFNPYTLNNSAFHGASGISAWYADIPTGTSNPSVAYNNTSSNVIIGNTVSLAAGKLAFHPGLDGQYSIIRWIAPSSGNYDLETTFAGLDFVGQTTTDIHIFHQGTELFSDLINGFGSSSQKSYTNSLLISGGDFVDFVVGVGNNGNYYFDSTGIDVTISSQSTPKTIPESASGLGILAFGFIVLGLSLKRQSNSSTSGF